MTSDEQVLDDRHLGEDPQQLKGSGETKPGYLMRLAIGDVLAAKPHQAAGVRRIDAGYQIEQGALAGAVWADDPANFALANRHRHVRQGDEPAKPLGQAGDLEQRAHMALAAALPVRSATKRRVARRRSI